MLIDTKDVFEIVNTSDSREEMIVRIEKLCEERERNEYAQHKENKETQRE